MIVDISYFIIVAGAAIAALLSAVFLFETIAALALPEKAFAPASGKRTRDRVGVLIPAHNEEDVLPETIPEILRQLRHGDRLLVVADNCSDRTAAVASSLVGRAAIPGICLLLDCFRNSLFGAAERLTRMLRRSE